MKTIQMTLDDELVERVDKVVKKLHSSRSAFTRDALRSALEKHNTLLMEQKHLQGYSRKPVDPDEFRVWEDEQDWGDI
jgi:metal-responsive CopG/Arc/MetJ family transcriptional regulator